LNQAAPNLFVQGEGGQGEVSGKVLG
jgi:hypothetical protein